MSEEKAKYETELEQRISNLEETVTTFKGAIARLQIEMFEKEKAPVAAEASKQNDTESVQSKIKVSHGEISLAVATESRSSQTFYKYCDEGKKITYSRSEQDTPSVLKE
ncbi:hypothetical protein M3936_14065 [Sutcliffiella horikoshii]|uniref:hypothetical protein n=1 Tax=Sutcliffiella horikoshii TaxID=79883 RepID=UPI0020400937|nr:hypothetical protein [Sutcliffiella horikoshii]MCM3618712.1 hypothetical protein [Sutcliffiella horikoshii]